MKTKEEKEKFIKYSLSKVYFYIESGVWSKLDITRLNSWLSNFKSIEENYYAAKLLDRLVYYSEDDIIQLLRYAIYEVILKRDLFQLEQENNFQLSDKKQIAPFINSKKSKLAFLALSFGGYTDSSHVMMRLLTSELGINEAQFFKVDNLEAEVLKKYDRIIIIDDILASSDQIEEFWQNVNINLDGKPIKLFQLSCEVEMEIEFVCLVATDYGLDKLNSAENYIGGLKITACEVLSDKYRVFNPNSTYLEKDEIEECKETLQNLIEGEDFKLMGHDDLDYAIAFHHGIPDCSLPLFYNNSNSWNHLFKNKKTEVNDYV